MWQRKLLRSGSTPETLAGTEVLLSASYGIWWITCSCNIHLSRDKFKHNKHLTLPTSPPPPPAHGPGQIYIYGMVWTHSHIIALMMETQMVPEMLVIFNQLTKLRAEETLLMSTAMKASYHITMKVKVKLSLCFNWAPCHEGVLGSGGIAPLILWPQH
jgi:hypothetical protein